MAASKDIHHQIKDTYQTIAKNIETLANQEGIQTKKPEYKLSFYKYNATYFSLEIRAQEKDDLLLRIDGQIDKESLPVVHVYAGIATKQLTKKINDYTYKYLKEQKKQLGIEYFF